MRGGYLGQGGPVSFLVVPFSSPLLFQFTMTNQSRAAKRLFTPPPASPALSSSMPTPAIETFRVSSSNLAGSSENSPGSVVFWSVFAMAEIDL